MVGYNNNRSNVGIINREYKRGDLVYMNIGDGIGSEQVGKRPCVILQNDIGNKYSPTIIVATITSQQTKAKLPTHVELKANECDLERDSVVLLEQIKTLDKRRIISYIGRLNEIQMDKINRAFEISTGLYNKHKREITILLAQIKTKDIGITYCLARGLSALNLKNDIDELRSLQENLKYKEELYKIKGDYEIQYEKYLRGEKIEFKRLVG